ncbi:MAG: hypothetical protein ACPGWR_05910 [Ardenticatenaceae bacterium]
MKRMIFMALAILLLTMPQWATTAPATEEEEANCLFFTETVEGEGAFSVCDDQEANFRTAFEGWGLQKIGYPISVRYNRDGFVTQAFQKAIMQWRVDGNYVALVNIFDDLHNAGFDDTLLSVRQTPHQLPASWDGDIPFGEVIKKRQALLNTRPALQETYFASSDPLTFYGLPTSQVEDMGNHYAIRLQRAVLQEWKEQVPWASEGEVTIANGGDISKELGALPAQALIPQESGGPGSSGGPPSSPANNDQDPARIAEMVRDTQPPILPRQAACVAGLPLEIYDDFNERYAAWVASIVQSGDLTPLHDNRLIVLEPGHGPTLVSYPRTYCSQESSNGNGMLLVIVNADGSYQLLDAVSGFPQQTPLPYSWIGDRFVLLVSLNEPYPPNEVAVEVWQIMLTDAGWQLQTHALPNTPYFSDIRGASGELQIMQHTHGVLGRVILHDEEPPCEFQPDSPFAAGGVWEDQRAFMFLEGEYRLWESHRVYSTIAPGGERLENWNQYCK